ncbi:MAG: DUF998 domain-containing protein [Thermoplasmata archaeon]|nr:DUF998 domain-containing protein [Thermoplasmata archaeon]
MRPPASLSRPPQVVFFFPLLAMGLFLVLTAVAISLFQDHSFWHNYLSDMGRPGPSAPYFNMAVVLTGIINTPFFLVTWRWAGMREGGRETKIIWTAALLAFASCIALTGVGIFPSTLSIPHNLSALGFFFLVAVAMVLFSICGLRENKRLLAAFGLWSALVVLVLLLLNFTSMGPTLQKLAVGHILFWMTWFSLDERKRWAG